jgi:hypothetical protein
MAVTPERDLARIVLVVLFIGALLAATLWILRPFLGAIIWAVMIVVATWPVMVRVQRAAGGRRWVAVTVMSFLLLLVLIVPLTAAIATVVEYVDDMVAWVKNLREFIDPAHLSVGRLLCQLHQPSFRHALGTRRIRIRVSRHDPLTDCTEARGPVRNEFLHRDARRELAQRDLAHHLVNFDSLVLVEPLSERAPWPLHPTECSPECRWVNTTVRQEVLCECLGFAGLAQQRALLYSSRDSQERFKREPLQAIPEALRDFAPQLRVS